ncbi:Double zinc ribbon [Gemmatirosa kalamazoonensis]|uniref:Double zinc ribbon n=1 Tax=Gemmatirosa kalamazoonensis TaxID=861299 RepID=W0RHK3_9BACT|nr:zinc ribbon domain-containing protein [Gemmatirosa kalamazoonensis]AHG89907.1 Double zinc ribbon [Gemmatirosa kalamazoonensis]
MDDLDRLHERLVANVRDGFPHLLERTFRLGDIQEHLVPYRTNRPSLRFESARQYELALMRLASGERGYLRVEPTVADAFRRALASPEPDAAVLRDHALATVALTNGTTGSATTTGATAEAPRADAPRADAPRDETATLEAPMLEAPTLDSLKLDSPKLDASWPPAGAMPETPPPATAPLRDIPAPSSHETRPGPTAIGGPCRYCGQALPEGRPVTYCPHCGQNVTVRHCPACSTELEVGWHYCITCGRAMDDAALGTGAR